MRRLLAVTLAFMGMALSTQDTSGGVYTGLSLPVGDLNDKSGLGTNQFVGTQVGGHLDFTLSPNHEVRAQVTYHNLPGSDWGTANGSAQNDLDPAGWRGLGLPLPEPKQRLVHHCRSLSQLPQGQFQRIRFQRQRQTERRDRHPRGRRYTFSKIFFLEGTLNQIFVDLKRSHGIGFDTATWVQGSAVFRFGRSLLGRRKRGRDCGPFFMKINDGLEQRSQQLPVLG